MLKSDFRIVHTYHLHKNNCILCSLKSNGSSDEHFKLFKQVSSEQSG